MEIDEHLKYTLSVWFLTTLVIPYFMIIPREARIIY